GGALPRARRPPAGDRPLPRRPRLRRLTERLLLPRQPPPPDRAARLPRHRRRQDAATASCLDADSPPRCLGRRVCHVGCSNLVSASVILEPVAPASELGRRRI